MTIHAMILGESPVRLWGLSSSERLRRQLREAGGTEMVESVAGLSPDARVLLLNGKFLFEVRTLSGFIQHADAVLVHPESGEAAAVLMRAGGLQDPMQALSFDKAPERAGLPSITPDQLTVFDEALKSARAPLLEWVTPERKKELEGFLYGSAYKGVTDLVTKFLWPRPARRAVRFAASVGMTPNSVTTIGLLLVIAACYLFLNGHYVAGLVAGWVMTFLDTVDGKLARVTVQSTQFGHLYDHIIDLVHPPFWYIYWGMSLAALTPMLGFDQQQMYWLIIVAYVGGRAVEGVFPLLGDTGIFTWRPFDSWFRLVTARRNPCLILLTGSVVLGRPDWGFVAVTMWSVLSTLVLSLRLIQGLFSRLRGGPLQSWLSAPGAANGPHAFSFSVFGKTRGAYGS